MPNAINPYDLNHVARVRAKLGPPCPECKKPTIQFPDGTRACIDGIGHKFERELGIRRSPPKGEPNARPS